MNKYLVKKFLENFISSRDGPVEIQGRDKDTREDYPTVLWSNGGKLRLEDYFTVCVL